MAQLDDLLGDGEGGLLVEPLEAAVAQDAPFHLQMLFFNAFFSPGFWQGCGFRIHLIRIRIQHFRLNTDPDPGVLMTKNVKKFTAEKKLIFYGSKTTIYYSKYGSGSTDSIESGFNPNPDPQPWFPGIKSSLLDLEFLSGFPPSYFRSTNKWPIRQTGGKIRKTGGSRLGNL
jgi:hypothetical protein